MSVARKYHVLPLIAWVVLGLFVMLASYRLGLGGLRNPGPGLMPFLLGLLLCLTSTYVLITFLAEKVDRGSTAAEGPRPGFSRLCLVAGSLFVYSLLFETLGFIATTFIVLVVLFRSMQNRWLIVGLASVTTVVVSYALFTYLGVQFPKGILKGL